MTSPFAKAAAPGEGGGPRIQQFEGCLIVWRPRAVLKDVPTAYGPKEATIAAIHVIAGNPSGTIQASPEQPIYEPEMWIFPGYLQGQLKPLINPSGQTMAVHRLVRGMATGGQQPPWLIDVNVSPADQELARRWYQLHGQNLPELPPLPTPRAQQAQPAPPPMAQAQQFQPQPQYQTPAPGVGYSQPPAYPTGTPAPAPGVGAPPY